ncbi:MAG: hypothetical protein ACOVQR_13880, partial [Flavobacterium sp.]|uniref:hypothetical protein n=1 Tax=Flavobacterium sp. TaxID=239 RepID=UPI003BA4D37C
MSMRQCENGNADETDRIDTGGFFYGFASQKGDNPEVSGQIRWGYYFLLYQLLISLVISCRWYETFHFFIGQFGIAAIR